MMTKASEYIGRIRNPEKRKYALGYVDFLTGVTNKLPHATIGIMARQALRLTLDKLVPDELKRDATRE